MKLGKRDYALLLALRQNARLSLTQMSKLTKIPISTLYDKLKAREKDLILKHTSLIDFAQLGYNTKVQMLVRSPTQSRNKIASYLQILPEVNSLYKLSNGYDFLVEGIFERIQDVHSFTSKLERSFSEIECSTHFVVKDMKREGFTPQAKSQ